MKVLSYTYKKGVKKTQVWMSAYLVGLLIVTSCVSITSFNLTSKANALSGSQFQAGNIIDDGVFFDPRTMTSMDIQNFLNAKVPACDTNGSKIYSGSTTRAQYGAANGNPAPYTCLKDFRQDTPNMPAESGLCGSFWGGNRSAAQIIRDVGDACNINPQVLLVLLQKEQSLITDEWPWQRQYTKATGFGCPDTAPCDPSYGGFFYQVYYGARAFKKYARDANQYNYFAKSNNNIRYSPLVSCGSSNVYIQNQATAGLYVYTPYQPNTAALNNLYGTGDDCSAYGNRNFWRMFNDWFGSTHAKPFAWQPVAQEFYTDAARTKPASVTVLASSTTYYLRLRVQNMGNSTWHNSGGPSNNQVNLATSNGRASTFANSDWLSANRPAVLREATVTPGEMGTFEFSIRTPGQFGNWNEYFNLVAEGQTWLNDVGLYWPLRITPPTPLWQLSGQEIFGDTNRSTRINTSVMAPNTTYYVRVKARNTGNTNWTNAGANPTRLGTSGPVDRASQFADSSWIAPNRAALLKESLIKPGETGTFEFSIRTPGNYKTYNEYFQPVVEGSARMNDIGMYWPFSVVQPVALWQYQGQGVYVNNSLSEPLNASNVAGGARFYAVLKALNTGNVTWTNNGPNTVRLGTSSPSDRTSQFCDASWLSCNRAATLKESSVAPGQVGTFEFWMKAPYGVNGTSLTENFRPVIDGSMWLNDRGLYWKITLNTPDSNWGYISQGAYMNAARTNAADLSNASTDTTYYLRLQARNTSGKVWKNNGQGLVVLGTSSPSDRTSQFCDASWLSCNRAAKLKEASVAPGQVGTFEFSVRTPANPITKNEYFTPVLEGITWLQDVGQYWRFVTH
ncbi:MAG: hypothetical protein WBP26_05805 [Candidatus Saccharimonadales bacterium]